MQIFAAQWASAKSYLRLLGVSKCVFFSGTLEISSGVSKVSLFDEWGML